MKLSKFNKITAPKTWNRTAFQSAKVTFGKSGTISFNKKACELINLKPGDKVELAQDEDNLSSWYLSKSNDGYELRGKDFDKIGQLTFNHKTLVSSFLDSFDFPIDVTRAFEISSEPVRFEKNLYYEIKVEILAAD